MAVLEKDVRIGAEAGEIYEALTTQAGYAGWWAKDCEIGGEEGGVSTLHFDKQGTVVTMRFRTEELEPERKVVWSCVANDAPSWIGTTLEWRISSEDGASRVALRHGGWQAAPPAEVGQGWDHFLASLKSYVEKGAGQPW